MRDITQYISGCREGSEDLRAFEFAIEDDQADEVDDAVSMFEFLVEHAKDKEKE